MDLRPIDGRIMSSLLIPMGVSAVNDHNDRNSEQTERRVLAEELQLSVRRVCGRVHGSVWRRGVRGGRVATGGRGED